MAIEAFYILLKSDTNWISNLSRIGDSKFEEMGIWKRDDFDECNVDPILEEFMKLKNFGLKKIFF